jgi:hypothetical protein
MFGFIFTARHLPKSVINSTGLGSYLSSTQFVVSHVLNELFVGEIINF